MSGQNPAFLAAIEAAKRLGEEVRGERAVRQADCPKAQAIIQNNPVHTAYGHAGAHLFFHQTLAPNASICKRRAAEAILRHRAMRRAGGKSDEHLRAAAKWRAEALRQEVRQ